MRSVAVSLVSVALALVAFGAGGAVAADPLRQYIGRVFAGSRRQFPTLTDSTGLPDVQALTLLARTNQYTRLTLPFTFHFFADQRIVTIGRDGTLFFDRKQPSCCTLSVCSFFRFQTASTNACNFNTAYMNAIAASTTYYDPTRNSLPPPIGWFADSALRYFWVRYDSMLLYLSPGQSPSVAPDAAAFSVFLFPAGSIEIRYDTVVDPLPYGGWLDPVLNDSISTIRRPWMVGVRPARSVYPTAEFATQWNTTQPGIYVPRVDFGISPTFGRLSGGDQLNWASSDWSCASTYGAHHFKFACRFGNTTLQPNPNDAANPLSPTLDPNLWIGDTPATFDPVSNVLSCRVPAIPSALAGTFPGGSVTSVWLVGDPNPDPALELIYGANTTVFNSQHTFVYLTNSDPILTSLPAPASGGVTTTDPTVFDAVAYRTARCLDFGTVNTALCRKDCNNTYFGSAAIDDCGVCSGGATGIASNRDKNLCGVCFGKPFVNLTQCVPCEVHPTEIQCTPDTTSDIQTTLASMAHFTVVTLVAAAAGFLLPIGKGCGRVVSVCRGEADGVRVAPPPQPIGHASVGVSASPGVAANAPPISNSFVRTR